MQVIEGQIFLRQGSRVPAEITREAISWDAKWLQLAGNAKAIEQNVKRLDWHLFRLTDQVAKWGIGSSSDAALRHALQNALAAVPALRNAAEIIEIRQISCGSLFFCQVRIAVRHIQEEMILSLTPSVAMISPAIVEGKLPGFAGFSKQAII
ncbi:hypothetical protein [Terriglobus albidus]|uniref:hypothetical protein n=1 Tax=Terriglobus albidus TaxID=1592106 RepID=UPI0021DFCD80|nr:hypothetical protein [Terriglobus albidus]